MAITLIKRNCGTKKESPFQDYLNKGNFINLAPEVIVKKVVGPRVVENRYCTMGSSCTKAHVFLCTAVCSKIR